MPLVYFKFSQVYLLPLQKKKKKKKIQFKSVTSILNNSLISFVKTRDQCFLNIFYKEFSGLFRIGVTNLNRSAGNGCSVWFNNRKWRNVTGITQCFYAWNDV